MLNKEKTGIVLLISIFFMVSLFVGNSFQKTFGQSSTLDTIKQQENERFLDLGKEGYIKECQRAGIFDKSSCEEMGDIMENMSKSFQQNQTSNNTELQGTKSFVDNEKGISFEYPGDWHESYGTVTKGTREFRSITYDDPKFSLLSTSALGDIWYDIFSEKKDVKIVDKPSRILIGGEPAVAFTFTQNENEIMVAFIMHNNVPYDFEYQTLKKNYDQDVSTALDFFGSIRFLK